MAYYQLLNFLRQPVFFDEALVGGERNLSELEFVRIRFFATF